MPHTVPSAPGNDSMHPPAIFSLLTLRNPSTYRHLGFHFFQTTEKLWLCSKITLNNTSIRLRERSLSLFCSRYSLPPYVIREWVLEYLADLDMEPGYCMLTDAPVDVTGLSNILAFSSIFPNAYSSRESQEHRLSSFIDDEIVATNTRRLIAGALFENTTTNRMTKRKRGF